MAFTTWQDLYEQMLADLASRNWRVASYQIEGRQVQYSSFEEFRKALDYVKQRADLEAGRVTGRTYAKPVRPGW